jgi:hypothetical protein
MAVAAKSRRKEGRRRVGQRPVKRSPIRKKKPSGKNYNTFKEHGGQTYTGMQVGRSHTWHYDQGLWKETKVTPDRWDITYRVVKRRAGHAPEGTGVPVGTGYHWFILSHQFVEKLTANDYITHMIGVKFKVAHRRASKETWSSSDDKRRKEVLNILKNIIGELTASPQTLMPVPLQFVYRGKEYKGVGIPTFSECREGICNQLHVTLNKQYLGIIRCTPKGWRLTHIAQGLTNAIGEQVFKWYE